MTRIFFYNKFKSYLLAAVFGILAGLAVAFFSSFPADGLWAFALFSSTTFGFWMCTASLMALYAEKNYTAGICVALYVFFMFYVTGIFKRLATTVQGYSTMAYFYMGFLEELLYGLLPAIVCLALAFILWYGRKNMLICKILRFAPAAFILVEFIALLIRVITERTCLFMTIVDGLCFCMYVLILIKEGLKNERHDTAV